MRARAPPIGVAERAVRARTTVESTSARYCSATLVKLVSCATTLAASRCALPSGIDTWNVVPCPTVLSAATVPPCRAARSLTSARPMPLPSCVRDFVPRTRWKRSKSWGSSSGAMPTPVSLTLNSAMSPVRRSDTVMAPSKVNFKAFESRLRRMRSHIARSTNTGSARSVSTVKRRPALSIAERRLLAMSRVSAPRSVAANVASLRPASRRENSSSVLTSLSSRNALRRAVVASSAWRSSPARVSSSSGPSISVSGVRNSWLTFEKKTVFARSISASISMRCRSSSAARAF